MIELKNAKMYADYTEVGEVEHDCATVGQFMTEAAAWCHSKAIPCGFCVEGYCYDIAADALVKITDETPIGEVTYTSGGTPPIVFHIKDAHGQGGRRDDGAHITERAGDAAAARRREQMQKGGNEMR